MPLARRVVTIEEVREDDRLTQPSEPQVNGQDSVVELSADWTDGHPRFADRRDAGRRLAAVLADFRHENPVVVGMPPGGMPVAAEVARALSAPLDVVGLRAIAAPEDPDRAVGVLADGEVTVIDRAAVGELHTGTDELAAAVEGARRELDQQLARYFPAHRRLAVAQRTALLVDQGLVSSASVRGAARSLRARGSTRVVLAVPVAEADTAIAARESVDEVICLEYRRQPRALKFWYDDFSQTSEQGVMALLSEHAGASARQAAIEVASGAVLSGDLTVPWGAYARGAVLIAQHSRSTRDSQRNQKLAAPLNRAGLGGGPRRRCKTGSWDLRGCLTRWEPRLGRRMAGADNRSGTSNRHRADSEGPESDPRRAPATAVCERSRGCPQAACGIRWVGRRGARDIARDQLVHPAPTRKRTCSRGVRVALV